MLSEKKWKETTSVVQTVNLYNSSLKGSFLKDDCGSKIYQNCIASCKKN